MRKHPAKAALTAIFASCLITAEVFATEGGGDSSNNAEWSGWEQNNTIFIGSETYQEISPPADSPRTTDTPGQAGALAENEATDSADSAPAVAYADETTQQAPALQTLDMLPALLMSLVATGGFALTLLIAHRNIVRNGISEA